MEASVSTHWWECSLCGHTECLGKLRQRVRKWFGWQSHLLVNDKDAVECRAPSRKVHGALCLSIKTMPTGVFSGWTSPLW